MYDQQVDLVGDGETDGRLHAVMRAVRAHIHDHGLQAGDALPSEGAFAQMTGVSRTIVREAFRSLSALTLIDIGNGRRARVSAPKADVLAMVMDHAVHTDQATIQQIFDVRRTIERRTVALAALRRTDKEAAEIMALALTEQILGDYEMAKHGSFELVTSVEPCCQCLGVLMWTGVSSLVCGAYSEDAEAIGFEEGPRLPDWEQKLMQRGIDVTRGVMRSNAIAILQSYRGEIYNSCLGVNDLNRS